MLDQSLIDATKKLPGPILVIGASGFVGANLLRSLLDVRDDVYGTINVAQSWRLKGIGTHHLPFMDLLDPASVKDLIERVRPVVVFDCAAFGAYSFQTSWERIHRTNYLALVHLLEFLSGQAVAAYVHAGSSSEYGFNAAGPDEDSPLVPNSHYAVSKAAAAHHISFMGKREGFPCVNLRLYSVYGPYEDSSRLIPALIERGINGAYPPLVAPDVTHDFVHVDDVCAAFILAAVKMGPAIQGNSYNIGTGEKTTIRDVALAAKRVFAIETDPEFGVMDGRSWDLSEWFAKTARAERDLGWKARVGLEDGLRRTGAWWKEFLREHSFTALTEKERVRESKRSVSAVVACYKDGEAIPIMHKRLVDVFGKLGVDYEIIFVNDCSPDDSAERIREISAKDPNVIGISHSRNFGSQAAFRSGMDMASKQACVLLDGDLQDPPELIEEFVKKWRSGHDVVYGRRVHREMSWFQGMLYKVFYRIFSAASYIPMPRDAGDFSLIDRRVMRWLLQCQERDSFLRGLRAYVGFNQAGVDYVRPERMFGRSTNSFLRNLDWAKKGIFSFSKVPLNLLTLTGSVLFVFSVILSVSILGLKVFVPESAPRGVTTMLLLLILFGSLNVLGIGILGEYLGKIIDEVKGRPAYIRAGLIRGGKIIDLPEKKWDSSHVA